MFKVTFRNQEYCFMFVTDAIKKEDVYTSWAEDKLGNEYIINWSVRNTDWEFPMSVAKVSA